MSSDEVREAEISVLYALAERLDELRAELCENDLRNNSFENGLARAADEAEIFAEQIRAGKP